MDGAHLPGDGVVTGTVVADARAIAARVADPELPFITIEELGILRGVEVGDDGTVTVTVTPTYSGCPATEVIRDDIVAALHGAGYTGARVRTVLSPAWTTDDVTAEGRRKLEESGIAPPRPLEDMADRPVLCPRCRSSGNHVVYEFGSTACKALMVCDSCREPFDHFKEI